MEVIQAIVLFALGVGAAFLAYFAWQHVTLSIANSQGPQQVVRPRTPAISTTA